jgi:hypothetical protein
LQVHGRNFHIVPMLILVIMGATVGVWETWSYVHYNPWATSTPYSTYCASNKNINVNITTFQIRFIYTGSGRDYLVLINQDANTQFQSSAGACPLYFVDAVRVMGVNGSAHVFSGFALSPNSFVFANNGGFSGPQTASEIFPDFTIAYVGDMSYTGPLVIDIYSSS